MIELLLLIFGLLAGAVFGYVLGQRNRGREADRRIAEVVSDRDALANQVKAATAEALKTAQEQLAATNRDQRETDAAKSQEALKSREDAIRRLTDPLTESIKKVHEEARRLAEARTRSEAEIKTLLTSTTESMKGLRDETSGLTSALRGANTRGQWGEMQLKRCFEIAGMTEHVDFVTQDQREGDNGRLRPDAVVRLPSGRHIVVDSKVALDAYLDATSGEPDARETNLKRHAQHMRNHVKQLASKEYQRQFATGETPDFVVLFTPEASLRMAHEVDPDLTEYALLQGIIVTTPVTLIALLKTIALGWREETLAREAQQIADTARELHKRIGTFAGHLGTLGKRLDSATKEYNKAIGSFQSNVMPQVRRIESLDAGSGDPLDDPAAIEVAARELTIPEITSGE